MSLPFPVVLKEPVRVEPDASVYYELAANGVFQVRDNPLYRSVVEPRAPIPGLVSQFEHVDIKTGPIPGGLFAEIVGFFREVYDRCGAEAVVLLSFDPRRRTFRADAPEQTVQLWNDRGVWRPTLALSYRPCPPAEGFLPFGTVHSHASASAYASETDCHDESHYDGLHLVVGSFGGSELSVHAGFVAGGRRLTVELASVVEGFDPARPARSRAPTEWLERVLLRFGYGSHGAPRPLGAVAHKNSKPRTATKGAEPHNRAGRQSPAGSNGRARPGGSGGSASSTGLAKTAGPAKTTGSDDGG